MKFSELKLPSNKKFGFFFTFVFFIAAGYFYVNGLSIAVYTFASLAVVLLLTTLSKPDLLLPLNKLWMRFGLLLGIIISPIVLGSIFFGLFTPFAFLMRFCGRDELRLKFRDKTTYWIERDVPVQADSFKNQF